MHRGGRGGCKSKKGKVTRAFYLSPREPAVVFGMSVESAAGLTLRGGKAGAGAWAWLEDEVGTGPMTPTLPPRTPSSAECCLLDDCELCDSQRRPPLLVTAVAPPDPDGVAVWWLTGPPLSSDVLCDQKFKSPSVDGANFRGLATLCVYWVKGTFAYESGTGVKLSFGTSAFSRPLDPRSLDSPMQAFSLIRDSALRKRR